MTNRNDSTDRVHAAIKAYWRKHGLAPTVRELMNLCGYTTKSVVNYHLDKLVELGIITREKGRARTLTLTSRHKRPLEAVEPPRAMTSRELELDEQAQFWQSRGDVLIWKQNKGGTYSGFDVIHDGAGIVASST